MSEPDLRRPRPVLRRLPRPSRHRRPRRGIYILPSLLTVGNVLAGYASLVMADQGDFGRAAMLLVLAAVLDNLDGRVARLTGTTSEFGLQFDSIADVISFGVAPSFLVYKWGMVPLERLGWAAAFLFLISGAMRLARFNTQAVSDKRYFIGLPVPAAAMVIATLVFYRPEPVTEPLVSGTVLALVLVLSGLMISRVRYLSFKRTEKRMARQTFMVVGLLAVALAAVAIHPQVTLLGLCLLYVVSGIVPRRRLAEAWRRLAGREADDAER